MASIIKFPGEMKEQTTKVQVFICNRCDGNSFHITKQCAIYCTECRKRISEWLAVRIGKDKSEDDN
jgi:ribosomal protein L37E